jgi:TPR repeat protein
MAPSDETKMAELKRLLRRLDGLDTRRSAGANANEDPEQRDYVGTLRGALEPEDGIAPIAEKPQQTVSPRSAALLAGVIAALISTATVYVLMSAEERATLPSAVKSIGMSPPGPGSPVKDGSDAAMELVRSAALLLEKGNIDGARELLHRAAELGSGAAALELARSYDPNPVAKPEAPLATRETDPALARVWYDRARELGMADAAIPPQSSGR